MALVSIRLRWHGRRDAIVGYWAPSLCYRSEPTVLLACRVFGRGHSPDRQHSGVRRAGVCVCTCLECSRSKVCSVTLLQYSPVYGDSTARESVVLYDLPKAAGFILPGGLAA